jgi:hypothetical protein
LLFRPVAVMPQPNALANLIKKSRFRHAVFARGLLTVYRSRALVNTDTCEPDNLHIWWNRSLSLPHLVRRIIVRPQLGKRAVPVIGVPGMMVGPDTGGGAVAGVVAFNVAARSLAPVLGKAAASVVSNTPRPDVAVTFVSRHSWHRLTELPAFLTIRWSGPPLYKVPASVADAIRRFGPRAAAQLHR